MFPDGYNTLGHPRSEVGYLERVQRLYFEVFKTRLCKSLHNCLQQDFTLNLSFQPEVSYVSIKRKKPQTFISETSGNLF